MELSEHEAFSWVEKKDFFCVCEAQNFAQHHAKNDIGVNDFGTNTTPDNFNLFSS